MTKKTSRSKPNTHESKITELEHELATLKDSRARLAADYANLEKRIQTERTSIYQSAQASLLEKIFPVLDNFYRASSHAPTIALDSNLAELTEDDFKKINNYFLGLRMIEKQLEEVLSEAGLKRISTKGEPFNPAMHEAISHEPNGEVAADHIIDEIESGWQIDGKVIRPAKVRVSKG